MFTILSTFHIFRNFHENNFPKNLSKLEKEMATHSSVLAWRIPGTGEPGGLPKKKKKI